MATANGPEPDLNFDELFAGEQSAAPAKAAAPEENLDELEAFLDEFEKNLDDEAKPAPAAQSPTPAAAATSPTAAPEPAFAEPEKAEALVQGLLKEDELNLDVEGDAAPTTGAAPPVITAVASPAPRPQDDVPEFEPQPEPLPPPAFIHAVPATGKPVPAAAAGFSRIGFILALVLGGVALLIAIGAGWMAWSAAHAVTEIENRVAAPTEDPRIAKIAGEVTALRKQVDEMAKVVGPVSQLAESYPRDMAQLQERVAKLEQPPASPVEAAPAPNAAVPVAAPKEAAPQPVETAPAATPAPASPPAPAAKAAPAAKPAPARKSAEKPAPALKGNWLVYLSSTDEKPRAQRDLERARKGGLAAVVTMARISGKTWYRVTVPGFATAEEARAFVAGQAKQAGFDGAWIGKR